MILPNVQIGKNCHIHRAIIDEGCVVPDGTTIGTDAEADASRYHVTENGVVLVTREMMEKREESAPHLKSA